MIGTQHAAGGHGGGRQRWVCSFDLCRLWQRGKAREGGIALSHRTLSHRPGGRRGEVRTCLNGTNLEKTVVTQWGFTKVTRTTGHRPTVLYANCPFLKGSLQSPEDVCHLSSGRQGAPKACCPVRGFKYQVLREQLGPEPPRPLPGRMGLVRVRER